MAVRRRVGFFLNTFWPFRALIHSQSSWWQSVWSAWAGQHKVQRSQSSTCSGKILEIYRSIIIWKDQEQSLRYMSNKLYVLFLSILANQELYQNNVKVVQDQKFKQSCWFCFSTGTKVKGHSVVFPYLSYDVFCVNLRLLVRLSSLFVHFVLFWKQTNCLR